MPHYTANITTDFRTLCDHYTKGHPGQVASAEEMAKTAIESLKTIGLNIEIQSVLEDHVAQYVEREGTHCPYCDSDMLSPDASLNQDGGQAWQTVACEKCGKKWVDIYKIVGIDTIQ